MKTYVVLFGKLLCAALVVSLSSCSNDGKKSTAKVAKRSNENDLAYVTLSKKAHTALKIESAPIRRKTVVEQLPLTGWVMAAQGSEVTLTAPVSGHVLLPNSTSKPPIEGQSVKSEQQIYVIKPVLSPVEQIQMATLKRSVQTELIKANTSLDVAKKGYERIDGLFKKGLRSDQELEKANEMYQHAKEDLKAAKDKQKLFELSPIPVSAPIDGTVMTILASPGQFVMAAAPLVTIADMRRLWVRVPVPEFDYPAVNRKLPIRFTLQGKSKLGGKSKQKTQFYTAKPIAMAPKVDPLKHTVDMYYELSDEAMSKNDFVKDQMLDVFVPLGHKSEQTLIPYSAVTFDGHGGAWIYLDRTKKSSPEFLYERRRVQLGPTVDDHVVIRPPAEPGDIVVTRGAGVLMSREFHSPPVR